MNENFHPMIAILIAFTRHIKSARENSVNLAEGQYDHEEDYYVTNKEVLKCFLQYGLCARIPPKKIMSNMAQSNLDFNSKEIELFQLLIEYLKIKSRLTEDDEFEKEDLVDHSKLVRIKLGHYKKAFEKIKYGVIDNSRETWKCGDATVDWCRNIIRAKIIKSGKNDERIRLEVEINMILLAYDLCLYNHQNVVRQANSQYSKSDYERIDIIDKFYRENQKYRISFPVKIFFYI